MAFPGTPIGELFPLSRLVNPLSGFRTRQAMSPTHNLFPCSSSFLCPLWISKAISKETLRKQVLNVWCLKPIRYFKPRKGKGLCTANCRRFALPKFVRFKPSKSSSTGNSNSEPLSSLACLRIAELRPYHQPYVVEKKEKRVEWKPKEIKNSYKIYEACGRFVRHVVRLVDVASWGRHVLQTGVMTSAKNKSEDRQPQEETIWSWPWTLMNWTDAGYNGRHKK